MGIIDYICVVVIFATLLAAVLYPIYYFLYKEKNEYLKSLNKISFSSFVAFYNIAPTKWTLNRNCVVYETLDMDVLEATKNKAKNFGIIPSLSFMYRTSARTYEFTFKLLDMIKYKFWHKQLLYNEKKKKKHDERQKNYEQYQEALGYIKQDLEQFKQSKPWEDMK